MQTANNAGINAVAVSWGFRPRQELETYCPFAIIDKAEDLIPYIMTS
jgi:phosphoglycolate phosphatase